jgi:hypothetical protein
VQILYLSLAYMANVVEVVIKQTGTGNAIDATTKALGGLGGAAKGVTGMLGGFGGALGNMATIAGGIVAANIFGKIVEGITGFVSTGLEAVGSSQQLETSLKALLTANNMYEQTTETVTAAVTKQVMSQEELAIATDELNAKLMTQRATYQEQQQRIIDLTAAYGENGLNVIKAKAQHDQLALSIQATERELAGLTTTETEYTTSTKSAWQQTMDQADAFKIASRETKDLLDFVSRLAVVSPFETETVEMTTKYAIAAGLGVEQTKEFVPAFLDLAGAVGITSDSLGFAADQLFQVKRIGKLTEVDLRQLRRLGIDLAKVIGVEMGMSVEEFNAQAENSPEIFDELFAAVTRFSQNTFAGTAREMATSVKGLQSTFSDIFVIGARTFLRPLVDAATPAVAAIAGVLSDFVLGGPMATMGEDLVKTLAKGMSKGRAIFNAFGRDWGEGIRMALYQFGFGPDTLAIVSGWIEQAKALLATFGSEGLFGSGDTGGLLRALGLTDETVGILQSTFAQVSALVTDFATAFGTQMESITTGDILNALAVGFSVVVSGIVAGINIVVPALAGLVEWFTANWPVIAATVLTAWTVIQAVFNGIVQGITASVGPAIEQIGATFTSLGINWADVGNALLTATGLVFAGIGAAILVAISIVVGLVGAVVGAVGTIISVWDELVMGVSTAITGIIVTVTSLMDFWTAVFAGDIPAALLAAQTGFSGMATFISGIVTTIQASILGMGGFIVGFFGGLVASITAFWQGLFDTLVGHSIIPDMVTGIISWFTTLTAPIMAVFETLSSGITTVLSAVFGALSGGGEGTGIDFSVLITTLTETIPALVTMLGVTFTTFFTTATLQVVMLGASFTLFITTVTEQVTGLTVGPLTMLILTMSTIYIVHLPLLVATWTSSTAQIVAQITTTIGSVNSLIGIIAAANSASVALTTAIVSGMKSAGDAFKKAADKIEDDLIQAIKAAIKEFEKMKEAAEAAAQAAKGAGSASGAAGGLGFASGTGPLGFQVPPGFPNDSFPLRVQSGERVLVAPAGRSIEDVAGMGRTTNNYFSMTVNTRADSSSVINDFGVMQMFLGA